MKIQEQTAILEKLFEALDDCKTQEDKLRLVMAALVLHGVEFACSKPNSRDN